MYASQMHAHATTKEILSTNLVVYITLLYFVTDFPQDTIVK